MLARILLLIVFALGKEVFAGEKKIQLKDGTTKLVHVSILGNPVHYKGLRNEARIYSAFGLLAISGRFPIRVLRDHLDKFSVCFFPGSRDP